MKYDWIKIANENGFDVDSVPDYMYTPNAKKPNKKKPVSVCLFAGAGGASLGMKLAGLHTAVAIDNEKWCMLTYMTNLGKDPKKPVCFIHKDIRSVTGKEILKILGKLGYKKKVDYLWTSPPCQDFSNANSMKITKIKCSLKEGSRYCMLESVRLIDELRPKCFIMENVPGLVQGKLRVLFNEFLHRLVQIGYRMSWKILDAADYGVPQHRKRVIALGMDIKGTVESKLYKALGFIPLESA